MKGALRERIDFFLAKIAGRDVDIGTLHPPVAIDTTEELLLEIANKYANADTPSGGGDPLILTPSWIPDLPGVCEIDATYNQIKEAVLSGRQVFLYTTSEFGVGSLVGYLPVTKLYEWVDVDPNSTVYGVYFGPNDNAYFSPYPNNDPDIKLNASYT